MKIEIVTSEFKQWASIHALLEESFAYMDGRIDPRSSLHGMDEDVLRIKATKERLIVAFEGTELVGCAYADVRAACVYISKVAVAKKARNRGIARQLMAAAESVAVSCGRRQLELQTRVELVENHKTFRALGFEKVAETAHPGYTVTTSITMQREIKASRR